MSSELLERLDGERTFHPRARFHELTIDYVPFDDLTATDDFDGRIDRALRTEAGCIAVIGPSGSGKSAAIAATVERLQSEFPCLRIPVAAVGDVAGTPVAFGQHILRESVRQAGALLADHQRQALETGAAERQTKRGGAHGIAAKLKVGIPGLSLEVAGDLKDSALDQETDVNATGVLEGLHRLVRIFESRGGPPILIFEDTDAWLGTPEGQSTANVANEFFANSLGVLVREIEIRSIIATHSHYIELDGYRAIRGRLLAEVEIPALTDAKASIVAILQRRIAVSEVDAPVADVFTEEAISRLVAEYDHSNRSIRHVLQVCDTALGQTAPSYPDQLTEDHVRGASVGLTGHS